MNHKTQRQLITTLEHLHAAEDSLSSRFSDMHDREQLDALADNVRGIFQRIVEALGDPKAKPPSEAT